MIQVQFNIHRNSSSSLCIDYYLFQFTKNDYYFGSIIWKNKYKK